MSSAVDFLLCCTGASVLLVSGAWSIRLLLGTGARRTPPSAPPARVPEELTPAEHDLSGRLQAFQTQRYAPVITRRQVEHTPTPGEPGGPRVVPPRILQPRTRPFSVPKQPPAPPRKGPPPLPKQEADVIPFPLKQKRDDTTKKD